MAQQRIEADIAEARTEPAVVTPREELPDAKFFRQLETYRRLLATRFDDYLNVEIGYQGRKLIKVPGNGHAEILSPELWTLSGSTKGLLSRKLDGEKLKRAYSAAFAAIGIKHPLVIRQGSEIAISTDTLEQFRALVDVADPKDPDRAAINQSFFLQALLQDTGVIRSPFGRGN